jgi:copper chaperone
MKQVNLKVAGMTCGHCVKAVEEALSEVPGAKVESVRVGHASVATEDSVPVGVLIDAVSDAGYEAEEE